MKATLSSGRLSDLLAPAAAFLIGAAAIWLPPRPPMIDLPQFAGQIALLKGLLTGTSGWAANLRIDALTPYLVGYALTLPLAFLLPITVAVKTVLTASLAAFGLAAAAIRRELGASRSLDAFALIGFFGFDYAWGLITFLVAAPIGLLVIWLSLRYARAPSWRSALALAAAGGVLQFAHALVLLFSVGLGFLLTLPRARDWGVRLFLARLWPFAGPLTGGLLLFLVAQHGTGGGAATLAGISFGPLLLRLLGPLAAVDDRPEIWTFVAWVALVALPFVGGLQFEVRPAARAIIGLAVFGVLTLGPDWAWVASGIYRRFALFAPAAWAWLFSDADGAADGLARIVRPRLPLIASALTGLILAQHVVQAQQFARENGDFEAVLASARPGERALGLVLNKESSADVDLHVYWHFPSWYQAEKGGLVDPSFASGAPSIVRYRKNPSGLYSDPLIGENPARFDWERDRGHQWTYFLVRGAVPHSLFAGAECPPVKVNARGAWTLFESRRCPIRRAGPADFQAPWKRDMSGTVTDSKSGGAP